MASRNQVEGHRWERTIAQMLRNSGLYPNVVTARSTNRTRDGQGVDFCNKEEAVHGRMTDDIQAKTTVNSLSIRDLIENIKQHDVLDERRPVIFWRQTGKSAGGKFMVKGHFAISVLEDHVKLLQHNELSRLILPHLSGFLEYLKEKDFDAAATIAKRAEELGF